jgi:5-methylthioadenosine/S-adenosylhomocysteine deaminase
MATIESAKLLGIDTEVGTLEVGKRADLILIDLDKPHLQPVHDLHALIAYSTTGADVDTTIVNGQILMRGRQLLTMSWEEIRRESAQRAARLVDGL